MKISFRTANKRRNLIDINFIRQNPVVYKYRGFMVAKKYSPKLWDLVVW